MKPTNPKPSRLLVATVLSATLTGCGQNKDPEGFSLENSEHQTSYLMGYEMARQLQRDGVKVNPDALAHGVRDALAATATQVKGGEAAAQVDTAASNYVALRKELTENLQQGQNFLAQNASKEGVITLQSGLQYKVIKEGSGAQPTAKDTVEVHYHGTLVDGTVFDSSVARGETLSFPLPAVIKGWSQGLQLMREGGKTMLYIPAELAYGTRRRSAEIGPNSTLIFEVELLAVNPE